MDAFGATVGVPPSQWGSEGEMAAPMAAMMMEKMRQAVMDCRRMSRARV